MPNGFFAFRSLSQGLLLTSLPKQTARLATLPARTESIMNMTQETILPPLPPLKRAHPGQRTARRKEV